MTIINNPNTGQDEKERIIIKILFKKDFWRERWGEDMLGNQEKKRGESRWGRRKDRMAGGQRECDREEERGNQPEGQRAWTGGEKRRKECVHQKGSELEQEINKNA